MNDMLKHRPACIRRIFMALHWNLLSHTQIAVCEIADVVCQPAKPVHDLTCTVLSGFHNPKILILLFFESCFPSIKHRRRDLRAFADMRNCLRTGIIPDQNAIDKWTGELQIRHNLLRQQCMCPVAMPAFYALNIDPGSRFQILRMQQMAPPSLE